MKPVRIIISVVIVIFSLYVVGSSISNLQNIDEKYGAETQELVTELNKILNEQLELCTTTDHLGDLKGCKSESIPKMIERCNDPLSSNLSVCSDVRLQEFSNTIDKRIETASSDFSNKMNIVNSKIDAIQFELIEHCSVLKINLDSCKNSMLDMKNECLKEELRDLPSCNDPRIEEILNREPLSSDDVIENSNNQVMDFLASCMQIKTKSCVDSANKMIELCNIDASVQACNDPRLDEIANYDVQSIQDTEITNPESTSEQSQMDFNIQRMYGATIRGCIEDNEIFANYMLTIVNLDSIDDGDERLISVYNGVERLNICSADIREIESKYCNSFNPSCTETGKFEMFWEVIPRIQSSFDQVCTNTGKLCNYAFHKS